MPRKISTLIGTTTRALESKGVFDGFVDIDSQLHIDPSLLKNIKIKEFKNSNADFSQYFNNVLTLIKNSKKENDALWNEAWKRLQFKEEGHAALGYAKKGTKGSAIGPVLAKNILITAKEIIDAGIDDPVIFELVGVIEDKVGADRISDMTISILFNRFLEYTARVSQELNVITKPFTIKGQVYYLPNDLIANTFIVFMPKKLLNGLPVASDWSDIDIVCAYNAALRKKLNKIIGRSWKSAINKITKKDLRKLLLDNPELLQDLIQQYKAKPKYGYDFENDPLGEIVWAELSESAPTKYPLNLRNYNPISNENILEVIKAICHHFGSLIECNGWFEYLYDEKGKQKKERAPQLLFYGIAEAYCEANNLSLDRETNAGVGSLDFKLSRGFDAKVNVELKYSTNTDLIKGFQQQLPAYNRAEKTNSSIYLIIQTKNNQRKINNLLKIAATEKAKKNRVPEIIVIDGRKQLSASRRK
jgi:hypothetical protein